MEIFDLSWQEDWDRILNEAKILKQKKLEKLGEQSQRIVNGEEKYFPIVSNVIEMFKGEFIKRK